MTQPVQTFTFIPPGHSPTELKSDPFLRTKILQHVDDWIFREAERWPHPWRFLLGVRRLPPAAYDLFKAAESVSHAMNRLLKTLYGGATLQRDLIEEMQRHAERGDEAGAERLAMKELRQLLKYGLWKPILNSSKMPDEARREIESWETAAKRTLARHGQLNPLPLPHAKGLNPTACLLISFWLRWGENGEPGLCYYSDEALADLIVLLLGREGQVGLGTQTVYYRKIRQRLKLEQAYYREPLVTKVRRLPNSGLIEIELQVEEGTHRHILSHYPPHFP